MAYSRTVWADSPATSSPIQAAPLNNIESELVLLDALPRVPTPVNGQWLTAAGGAAVWAALPAIAPTIVDAKGDLIGASANDTPVRVPAGTEGQVPVARAAAASGIAWEAAASGSSPTGAIFAFGGATAPTGFLLCDGASVSTTTYAALFAVIGYAYGGSGGSFNLPDLRGRSPHGKGSNATMNALGNNDGVTESARSALHRHTVTDPGHSHTFQQGPNVSASGLPTRMSGPYDADGTTTTVATGISVGPAGTALDAPAYLVVNYIIKT